MDGLVGISNDSGQVIVRASLSEQVADFIRDQILTGRLQSGERVLQAPWAERLGVSRMPVRDAIKRLCNEGILIPAGVGSATVADINQDDIKDSYQLSGLALSLAARRAAERATDEELDALKQVHARMQDALEHADHPLAQRLNVEFHRVVGELAHSPSLMAVLRLLSASVSHSSFELYPHWPERALSDHERILTAIVNRDREEAGRLMLDHIHEGSAQMISLMSSAGAPLTASS